MGELLLGTGGPPKGSGGVERPNLRSGKVWEAYTKVRKGSGDPPEGLGGVGRTTRRSERG